jgi:predicted porin
MQLVDDDVDSSDRLETTLRLLYGSVGSGNLSLSYGKNWSVYYNVANVTDRFLVYGGRAAGVYNADTDGGASGTGRADKALQLRSARKKFEWGLQLQRNEKIPRISQNIKYGWNSSLSGLYRWENGITSGFAYNLARPERITAAMQAQGITGDAKAKIFSANYLADDDYIGVTLARTENHDTDNKQTYLDTEGWEIYYRHDLNLKWRLIAGLNRLKPASNDYLGKFDIKETIIGAQFTFGERDFTDMVFVEAAYRQGHLADGSPRKSQITVGFRYRFSY